MSTRSCSRDLKPELLEFSMWWKNNARWAIHFMQNFELISFAGADELARAVAGAWLDEIAAANRAVQPQSVALSGGRIALKFFSLSSFEGGEGRGEEAKDFQFRSPHPNPLPA